MLLLSFPSLLAHWVQPVKKMERWISSVSGCFKSWLKNFFKKLFWSVVFSYAITMNHFSSGLWHGMKSGFYITGNDQLGSWTEKKLQSTSQSQACTKKRSWSFGSLLHVLSTTTFWIPDKSLHLSIFNKLMRCTKSCNTCSQHWSTERAEFFSITTPDPTLHNQCLKSWTNWAMKFCLVFHSHLTYHQLTTTHSSISSTFCRENASTTNKRKKILSKSLSNPKTQIFMLQE